jgi:hypothetical protein
MRRTGQNSGPDVASWIEKAGDWGHSRVHGDFYVLTRRRDGSVLVSEAGAVYLYAVFYLSWFFSFFLCFAQIYFFSISFSPFLPSFRSEFLD